jgi:hypothetical protein
VVNGAAYGSVLILSYDWRSPANTQWTNEHTGGPLTCTTLHVRQGRVAVTGGSVVDDPKSQRSRRDMPLPA